MKREVHQNSLLFKIVCTVVGGIVCLAVLLGAINLSISKEVFVENFAQSQRKIFYQIDSEFYKFYSDMADIISDIGSSENMKEYLVREQADQIAEMDNRFHIDRQLKASKIPDYNQISVFIVGMNEKSFIYSSSDVFAVPKEEILKSDVAQKVKRNPNKIICQYRKGGFTNVMKRVPVVIMAKALSYESTGEPKAIIFITMKESDIGKIYQHFTSNTSDIVLLNQDNEVVSSDNMEYLDSNSEALPELEQMVNSMEDEKTRYKEMKKNGNVRAYLIQNLQSSNYKIVGIINPEAAFLEQYGTGRLVVLTLAVTSVIVFLIFMFMRQQTKPLAVLVHTMRNSRKSEFRERVPVEGTYEVRELSETYNQMINELDRYIRQLITAEEDKRLAEIHALQMQINPHYMYNTLAGIKWLIWQGDAKKSTEVIDAFISLLRNVISNSDEFVSVEQEMVNLKNYVLINQARYGDAIAVEFFVLPKCSRYEIPKLMLQPFVENAFFHAFPEGRTGSIQIFVKEEKDNLKFSIVDDGVGMKTEQLRELKSKNKKKSEHFTGIGIGNVEDRIQLIYGLNYGLNIISEEGKGTTVSLLLPKQK